VIVKTFSIKKEKLEALRKLSKKDRHLSKFINQNGGTWSTERQREAKEKIISSL